MSGFRKPEVPREQLVLWSQRLDDALPDDHPVRQVDWLLRSDAFAAAFSEWERQYVLVEGKPPYHPRDLAGLYLYGMMNRIRSSRQLEGACWNRLDVVWLMSGQHPDHSTIAQFVKDHGQRLRRLFKDVLKVGRRAGLIKLELVSIDGTKVEADANKRSVHKRESIARELQKVEEQIAVMEAEWKANEAQESLLGAEGKWCPSPAGSKDQRLARQHRQRQRLEEALKVIARRQAENSPASEAKPIASTTDTSSRAMVDKEGRCKPNYNAQLAVDTAENFIVAADVNDRAEDSGLLVPMVHQVEDNCGALPREAAADSQYNTGPDLVEMEELGVTAYLPDSGQQKLPAEGNPASQAIAAARRGEALTDAQWAALPRKNKLITHLAFVYDPVQETYRCPMGHKLEYLRTSATTTRYGTVPRKQYGGCAACAACPKAALCCKNPDRGRVVNRDEYEPCRERLRARMAEDHGRSRYSLRKQSVEPRIGQIKHTLGLRRFLRRGWEGVRTEWSVMCTAVNIGILLRCWDRVLPILG
jgi:transposase